MVNSITNSLRLVASAIVIFTIVIVMSGCANYKLGNVSRIYCGTTNNEVRADIKATLSDKGVKIGVDYCSSFNLTDALMKGSR
jgi:hypothetical protein